MYCDDWIALNHNHKVSRRTPDFKYALHTEVLTEVLCSVWVLWRSNSGAAGDLKQTP